MDNATATAYPLTGLPMRPTATGLLLTRDNVRAVVADLEADGWLVQPKLNGDRVLLVKRAGIVEAWNRHGTRYSFSVAAADWRGLPDDTLLDGEGWQGRFYPFEAIELAGEYLGRQCPAIRASVARELCRRLGNAFLFDRPAVAWLDNCRDNLPAWEGIVAKRGRYYPTGKPWQESADWLKLKW